LEVGKERWGSKEWWGEDGGKGENRDGTMEEEKERQKLK